MGRILFIGAVLALALGAQAAATGETAQAPAKGAAQSDKPKNDLDQVVCRYEEVTGSRLGGRKVCHTRREWEQISADARDHTALHQASGYTCQPGMGC